VAVLWISSLLALLAAGAASSSRSDLRLADNTVKEARARSLADAGIHEALFTLLTERDSQIWQNGTVPFQFTLDGGEVQSNLRDEDSKVDLNVAPADLLAGLFRAVGVDDDQARRLAEHVVDFRDPDQDPEPLGAEDDAYVDAGRPQGAADRPFLNIAELNDVLGMTGEIYRRVRQHVTVHADVDGIDPSHASPTTLLALPGMTPEFAALMATQTENSDVFSFLPEDVAAQIEPFLLPSRERLFSIVSRGKSAGDGEFVREAIVSLDGGTRTLPVTILSWTRGRLPSLSQETR